MRDDKILNQFIRTGLAVPEYYALISTSTPLGKSSLLNASTVRLAGEQLYQLDNVAMLQVDVLASKNRLNPEVLDARPGGA